MLGLTQQQLGEMLGFSYQRVHKYECGVSRVSAGVLYQIAYMLNAPIGYFFNETGEQEQAGEQPLRPAESFPRGRREIARNFSNIRNKKHQEAFSHLVRALAGR